MEHQGTLLKDPQISVWGYSQSLIGDKWKKQQKEQIAPQVLSEVNQPPHPPVGGKRVGVSHHTEAREVSSMNYKEI